MGIIPLVRTQPGNFVNFSWLYMKQVNNRHNKLVTIVGTVWNLDRLVVVILYSRLTHLLATLRLIELTVDSSETFHLAVQPFLALPSQQKHED